MTDNNQQQEERRKCSRCKMNVLLTKFQGKRDGTHLKSCDDCLRVAKKWRDSNRCEHGKEKTNCKTCGGACICEHGRQKSICKECKGVGICKHQQRKSVCKICNIESYLKAAMLRHCSRVIENATLDDTLRLLGCDMETFKTHIETQFKSNMT